MDFVYLAPLQTLPQKIWHALCCLILQTDTLADSVGLYVCVFSPAAPVICFLSYLFNPLCASVSAGAHSCQNYSLEANLFRLWKNDVLYLIWRHTSLWLCLVEVSSDSLEEPIRSKLKKLEVKL